MGYSMRGTSLRALASGRADGVPTVGHRFCRKERCLRLASRAGMSARSRGLDDADALAWIFTEALDRFGDAPAVAEFDTALAEAGHGKDRPAPTRST